MFTRTQETPEMDRTDGAEAMTMNTLLTVRGELARIEGKFEIADSLEVQCEIGGELDVGGSLVIGERGSVTANVRTVDAIIMGTYEGDMIASGNVEITSTGRVIGNLKTDSLVIAKGGFFNGNVSKIEEGDLPEAPKAEPVRAGAKDEPKLDAKDVDSKKDDAAPQRPLLVDPEKEKAKSDSPRPVKAHGLGSGS